CIANTPLHDDIAELVGGPRCAGIEINQRPIRLQLAYSADAGSRVQAGVAVIDGCSRIAAVGPVVGSPQVPIFIESPEVDGIWRARLQLGRAADSPIPNHVAQGFAIAGVA